MAIPPELDHVRGLGVDAFIIAEDGRPLTLIDGGMPWSAWTIRRRIRAIGRNPEEIGRIVCTHGHPDHIGGIPRLLGGRTDASALMHPADIAGLAVGLRRALRRTDDGITRRSRLLDYFTPTPASLEPIQDGDANDALRQLAAEAVRSRGRLPAERPAIEVQQARAEPWTGADELEE